MTRIKTSKGEFIMVPIANGIKYRLVVYPRSGNYLVGESDDLNAPKIKLPSGTYEVMFTTGEVTEEQAVMVVDTFGYSTSRKSYFYRNYETIGDVKYSAYSSFASLLRSHNLNEDNYACIKLLK